jgi:hypothetical protein
MLWAKKGVTNVAMLHKRTLQIRTFLAPSLLAQKLPEKVGHYLRRNQKIKTNARDQMKQQRKQKEMRQHIK